MDIFARFPGGKAKALTLSYDDGVEQDIRLIEIMQKHGLKGTFNINSSLYAEEGAVYPEGQAFRRMTLAQRKALYIGSGMEVAMHTLTHPFLDKLPTNLCTYEVMQDRVNLEQEYNRIIRGFAYPYGTYNDKVVDILKNCGVLYARTTESTGNFEIPEDWLRLSATCHHKDPRLMELAEEFLKPNKRGKSDLFYLWGHSYEFELDDNWNIMECFAQFMGGRSNIWYATNSEIFEYLSAYRQLVFSTAGRKVCNPTYMEVWFHTQGKDVCVKPGETVSF